MTIQFNTDKTINGDDRHQEFFTEKITKDLHRFAEHITRIEVHMSDQNGIKDGPDDIRCLLEARLEGKPPIAVSNKAENMKNAYAGAIDKLKASLDTIMGKSNNH